MTESPKELIVSSLLRVRNRHPVRVHSDFPPRGSQWDY